MSRKILSLILLVLVLSGCAIVEKSIDTVMTPIDKAKYNIKSGYEYSKSIVTKSSNQINSIKSNITNNIIDNKVGRILLSEKDIQNSRENLISWKISPKIFITKNDLTVENRFLYFNKTLPIQAQKRYLDNFNKITPKPNLDEFESDRENIRRINEYQFKLLKSKNIWNETQDERTIQLYGDIFNAVYGNPIIKYKSYNIYDKKIYFTVTSQDNKDLNINISLTASKIIAQNLKNSQHNLKPEVYFSNKDKKLKITGVTIFFNQKVYIASIEDKLYERYIPYNIYDSNNKLDTSYANISYKQKVKSIKNKPQWYKNNIKEDSNYYYGYGMSVTTKTEAVHQALKDLYQNMGGAVTIISNISLIKNSDTKGAYSKKFNVESNQSINTQISGHETYKDEYYENVNFFAYKKSKK